MLLYKYLPPVRIDVLRGKKIRFTQPGDFNDPFEFKPTFGVLFSDSQAEEEWERVTKEEISKAPPGVADALRGLFAMASTKQQVQAIITQALPHLRLGLQKGVFNSLDPKIGLLCLSEVRDSLLMWGHYTDCHKGMVVGFDSEHPFFSKRRGPSDEFGFLRKVRYQRTRPVINFDNAEAADLMATKSEDWAYEKEWRMIRALADADDSRPESPYPICLFDVPPEMLREVIVGMRAAPAMISEIRKLLTGFPNAKLYGAFQHEADYTIEIRPI